MTHGAALQYNKCKEKCVCLTTLNYALLCMGKWNEVYHPLMAKFVTSCKPMNLS